MNIPKNVQEYINSLPPNQQKAAMNEIMRNQYSAYKNSPNQVNQQNMKTPIAPQAATSPELALPSKYSQEGEQESGNLQGNLQDMLVQYFEKMQFTEEQAKQFMQEFAKLSDEEKQQLVQELQQEIQGESMPEQSQEMPEEEMEEPMQEQSMMSGGRFPYMLKKKKGKEKLLVGGKLTEEQKKKIEESNKKRISDAANMEIEYEPGTIPPTTRDITVPFKSSTTTPVTTAPVSGKKVIRLEENGTNDYYEVDVDNNGKPIFNTKVKLGDTQKKDYSNKYYFNEPPTVTSTPTLDAPNSVIAINKKGNSSIVERKATTKTDSPQVTRNKELQKELNKEGYKLKVDGIIGTATYNALNSSKNFTEDLRNYSKTYPELKRLMSKSVISDTPTINTSVTSPVNNPVDSTKTATDSSFINKMFKDSLGVTIDTAKLQKPAPKKIVTIVPPSLNQSDSSYDKSETASITKQVGKKDINKGDKLLKVQPDTWDRWIDRGQADIGAVSMGASLTGVAAPVTKVVDAVSTGVDALQLAAAIKRGDVPEQWNQGIQVGTRFLVPAAGRVASTAIRKVMPEISEEVGKNIGKRFMNKVDNSIPYIDKKVFEKATQGIKTSLKDYSENLAPMSIKEAEDIMINADAYPDKEFIKRVAQHLQDSKAKINGTYVAPKSIVLKKPAEMTIKEADEIMLNPENYPASYVKEIGKHLTETKKKLKLGYRAPTSAPTAKSSEPVLKPKISTKVSDQSSADRYSLQKAQMSKPKPDFNSTSLKPTPKSYNTKPVTATKSTNTKQVVTAYPKYAVSYPITKKQFGGYYFM